MAQYISKDVLMSQLNIEISNLHKAESEGYITEFGKGKLEGLEGIADFISNFCDKEVDLIDRKLDWSPSKKQMESLHDMLQYNIGVFDYQKFMEVNSLYDDLTKISDYGTDRQK